ncbi:hypothetical protein VTJ83DRAFT_4109 [Remersonia thermophila]|uniref:LysM domain-containing protein n=1 Tax=Remersonia thermophila TaxID=72144 RepID=A0ABR4DFW8_9PEZI
MTNYNQGAAASYYAAAGGNQDDDRNRRSASPEDGPTGERGVLGAIGGAVAGGVGGNFAGKKAGHSKTGTVLGMIAGAVAGHKLQDGVSDWRESKKEEEEKKKREEEEEERREEEEKRRREEKNRPAQHSGGGNFRGNFSGSARDIRLDAHGDFVLHASCRRGDGSYQNSSISLNRLLENDNGSFRWVSGGGGGGHSAAQTYTVQSGDTLRDIASRYGTTYQELAQLNGIQNPDLIFPGQVFNIPQKGGHSSSGSGGNFGASARNVRLADGGRRLEAELRRGGDWVSASIALDERIGNDNGNLKFV